MRVPHSPDHQLTMVPSRHPKRCPSEKLIWEMFPRVFPDAEFSRRCGQPRRGSSLTDELNVGKVFGANDDFILVVLEWLRLRNLLGCIPVIVLVE